MYTQFEEKGKIFTPVVTKKPVRVIIQTTAGLVRGSVHIRPDQRLKDALEVDEDFLAVTEAEVLDANRQVLYQTSFLAVRQAHIVWILPEEELLQTGGEA